MVVVLSMRQAAAQGAYHVSYGGSVVRAAACGFALLQENSGKILRKHYE